MSSCKSRYKFEVMALRNGFRIKKKKINALMFKYYIRITKNITYNVRTFLKVFDRAIEIISNSFFESLSDHVLIFNFCFVYRCCHKENVIGWDGLCLIILSKSHANFVCSCSPPWYQCRHYCWLPCKLIIYVKKPFIIHDILHAFCLEPNLRLGYDRQAVCIAHRGAAKDI